MVLVTGWGDDHQQALADADCLLPFARPTSLQWPLSRVSRPLPARESRARKMRAASRQNSALLQAEPKLSSMLATLCWLFQCKDKTAPAFLRTVFQKKIAFQVCFKFFYMGVNCQLYPYLLLILAISDRLTCSAEFTAASLSIIDISIIFRIVFSTESTVTPKRKTGYQLQLLPPSQLYRLSPFLSFCLLFLLLQIVNFSNLGYLRWCLISVPSCS